MGMNMVSKGVERALLLVRDQFPEADVLTLSGNACTDKKAAAVNWVTGRGKTVVAEGDLTAEACRAILKSDLRRMARVHVQKNLVGSALAGSLGGTNAHAANIVAALFVATGQDVAQVGTSAFCLTQFELDERGESARVSVTLPCLEIATVGGGTALPAQEACRRLLGGDGTASALAARVGAAVLAGELSLLAALSTDDLVRSHMRLNR